MIHYAVLARLQSVIGLRRGSNIASRAPQRMQHTLQRVLRLLQVLLQSAAIAVAAVIAAVGWSRSLSLVLPEQTTSLIVLTCGAVHAAPC